MTRLNQLDIQKHLRVRGVILDKGWFEKDAGKDTYKLYYKRADLIEKKIKDDIINNFDAYTVEEILETLVKFGDAPNLVFDDNCRFAVSGDGYQPVVTGDELMDGSITVCVEPHMWKKTVREAIYHYLTYEEPPLSEEESKRIDEFFESIIKPHMPTDDGPEPGT